MLAERLSQGGAVVLGAILVAAALSLVFVLVVAVAVAIAIGVFVGGRVFFAARNFFYRKGGVPQYEYNGGIAGRGGGGGVNYFRCRLQFS